VSIITLYSTLCSRSYSRAIPRTPADHTERVQLGVALSAAEKLQALAGPWGEWVTELQKKFIIGAGTLSELLPKLDISRGRPFQILLSYIMIANDAQRIVPTSSNQTKFLSRTDQVSTSTLGLLTRQPEPEFRRKIEMAMSILIEICTDYYQEAIATVEARVAPAGELCLPRSQLTL
jgi:hypothetical protein